MKFSGRSLFQYWNKPERAAYLFITPSLLILLLFTAVPLISTLWISLLKLDIFLQDIRFLGLDNYARLWHDDRFWNALGNTVYFTLVEMPLQLIAALFTAVVVSKNTLTRKFLRSVFFLPSICSMTAIGIVWSFLLDPQMGMYPYALVKLGSPQLQFLRDPSLAMPSVILITLWRSFGYTMIILVSGIQAIPESYYEAAQIDGAGAFSRFVRITPPMLIPALSFCVITTTISALQVFDQIFVTTQGGPMNKTETVVTYIYDVGFRLAPLTWATPPRCRSCCSA
ncbi:sugar ABC transporter permease [Paenibacillus sp. P26]|nr:sugar ABC transporter permease [Paenibacillus sp. P26]